MLTVEFGGKMALKRKEPEMANEQEKVRDEQALAKFAKALQEFIEGSVTRPLPNGENGVEAWLPNHDYIVLDREGQINRCSSRGTNVQFFDSVIMMHTCSGAHISLNHQSKEVYISKDGEKKKFCLNLSTMQISEVTS